jgi:hypothetical protein
MRNQIQKLYGVMAGLFLGFAIIFLTAAVSRGADADTHRNIGFIYGEKFLENFKLLEENNSKSVFTKRFLMCFETKDLVEKPDGSQTELLYFAIEVEELIKDLISRNLILLEDSPGNGKLAQALATMARFATFYDYGSVCVSIRNYKNVIDFISDSANKKIGKLESLTRTKLQKLKEELTSNEWVEGLPQQDKIAFKIYKFEHIRDERSTNKNLIK